MQTLPQDKAQLLRLFAERIVPEVASLSTQGLSRFFTIIDRALKDRPSQVRRQFGAFLGLLRWAPLLRFGCPFERLSPSRQDATLRWFQECPLSLLRIGFWGLKTTVFMGYYGQVERWPQIGYTPEHDSSRRLHA
jgi:hypothetical protein